MTIQSTAKLNWTNKKGEGDLWGESESKVFEDKVERSKTLAEILFAWNIRRHQIYAYWIKKYAVLIWKTQYSLIEKSSSPNKELLWRLKKVSANSNIWIRGKLPTSDVLNTTLQRNQAIIGLDEKVNVNHKSNHKKLSFKSRG